jgi:hypothetical protein
MLKNSLEKTFYYHKEFHSRIKKKWYKDTIYRGMFVNTLLKGKYNHKELKFAEESNWIKFEQIKSPDGSHRNAYLWIDKEMPQREPFKIALDWIRRLIQGEFDEYYGPLWGKKGKK